MNTAAILVGGKGTRLQSLVSDVPKPLAMIAGEPFLFMLLRNLRAAGVTRVVLLTGYMHDKIVAACGDGKQFGLEIFYSQEQKALGTAGALKNAEAILAGCEEFLLLNGDTYLDCTLNDIISYPLKKEMMGVIGISEPEDAKRYGSILLETNSNKIKSFREKDENATQSLVSAGIYKISSKILEFIPCNQFCSLETDIFPLLLVNHYQLHAVRLSGDFCDIGVPESYAHFNYKKTLESPHLHPLTRMLLNTCLQKSVIIISQHEQCNLLRDFLKKASQWNYFAAKIKTSVTSESADLLIIAEEEKSLYLTHSARVLAINASVISSLNTVFAELQKAWQHLQISFSYFDSIHPSNSQTVVTE